MALKRIGVFSEVPSVSGFKSPSLTFHLIFYLLSTRQCGKYRSYMSVVRPQKGRGASPWLLVAAKRGACSGAISLLVKLLRALVVRASKPFVNMLRAVVSIVVRPVSLTSKASSTSTLKPPVISPRGAAGPAIGSSSIP